jgi:hypothetical protein
MLNLSLNVLFATFRAFDQGPVCMFAAKMKIMEYVQSIFRQ